jgi:drug/metabolite transporter (DMT)-like permease
LASSASSSSAPPFRSPRIALEGFSPAFITFCRAAIAASVAGATLALLGKPFPRQHTLSLFLAGLLLVYGFPAFSSVAMQTVPASHGGVVLGVLPLMTATFAALFGGERPGLAFWAWSLTGAALVLVFSLSGADIEPGIGDLWLACAALSASCGYVISGKLARTRPGWEVISWALVVTAPLSLAGTLLTWDNGIMAPDGHAFAALAYLSLGSMFAGLHLLEPGPGHRRHRPRRPGPAVAELRDARSLRPASGRNRHPGHARFRARRRYRRLVRPQGQGGVKKAKSRSSLDYNRRFLAKHPCSPSLEVHQIASS